MIVRCETCSIAYDDAERWTCCPHDRLKSPEDQERHYAALSLLDKNKPVRFAHQPDGPDHVIRSVKWDGMVSISDMPGWFAPHLFVVVP